MKIPGIMNWKTYAIIGAVVLVAIVIASKFISFEGKATLATDGTSTISLKPELMKKEA